MLKNNKKYFFFFVLFALFFASISLARASFWSDLWRGITAPFSNNSPVPSVPQPVPLYKPVIDYENAVVQAVKKASPGVVAITISKNVPIIESCPGQSPFADLPPEFQQFFGDLPMPSVPCEKGTKLQEVGGGSGFIITSDGLVLTNKHVAADKSASYTVFTNDGKKYPAVIAAQDPNQDLAILKIAASDLPTITFGNSDSLELGQTTIAIGNALGEFRNTVSVGVISGLLRTITASGGDVGSETLAGVIQTDAAINPGNSGGPLLNLKGEVIGINTAVAQGAQNIGFAIPINRARRDIQSVKISGDIQTAYLGVRNITITPDLAKKEKLPVDHGAIVRGSANGPAVSKSSPADRAGILAEDIILEVNGKKITEDYPLSSAISEYNVGDTIILKINRGGKELKLSTTLSKRPA